MGERGKDGGDRPGGVRVYWSGWGGGVVGGGGRVETV